MYIYIYIYIYTCTCKSLNTEVDEQFIQASPACWQCSSTFLARYEASPRVISGEHWVISTAGTNDLLAAHVGPVVLRPIGIPRRVRDLHVYVYINIYIYIYEYTKYKKIYKTQNMNYGNCISTKNIINYFVFEF